MKNSFRYWIIALTLPVMLLSSDFAFAGPGDFELAVRNQIQTAPNRLEFDVYLLDTDPLNDFYLSTEQLGILFNSLIYTGGTVSIAIDNTGSGLGAFQIIYQTPVIETDPGYPNRTHIKLAGEIARTPLAQCTLISKVSPGTLITHFILTSTVNFAAGSTPNLTFTSSTDVTPLYATRILTSDGSAVSEILTTSGGNAVIYGNPSLNSLPAAFNVTGGGAYCTGGSGLPVGLTDSETGVTYTLLRGGVSVPPSVAGTGEAISFGNQTVAGVYTVEGTNTGGTTTMTGNATITVNALPATSDIAGDATPACSGTGYIYSVTPTAGSGYAWTVPTGAIITAGAGTNSITVSFGTANGNIAVTETNASSCVGATKTLAISLTGCGLDANFTGAPLSVCAGATVTFTNTSIGTTVGTTYNWNFGSGASPATVNTIGPHAVTYSTSGLKTVSLTITDGASNTETKTDYITVNPLPAAAGTITGTASVCQGQSVVSYSVGAIANATSYTWAYSGTGVTISGSTNPMTINFAANATTGNLTVRGTNSCGNGTVSASYPITVNALPSAAGTITGTASVCQGQSVVSYSVGAISNATSYTWAYSGTGATISGSTNPMTINFATNATTGNLTVRGTNSCGNGTVSANYPVTVNALPATSDITGNATPACSGTGYIYSVTPTAGSGYAWTVPAGAIITAGAGTNSITVSFGTANGNIAVTETNASSCVGATKTLAISLTGCGLDANFTGAPLSVCAGATVTFTNTSVGTTVGTTYSWNFGSGASPATANTVGPHAVTYSTSGLKTVSLTITDGASNTETKTDYITVNPLPAAAGTITGTASVCQGQSVVSYSVGAIANATSYTWAYSGTGATISGSTNPMTINFAANATTGNLTVRGTNSCGNGTVSASYPITVNALPAAAGTITGTASVCQGQSAVSYSVGAIANATSYTWAYSGTGATISGSTNPMTINFATNATTGNLTVRGTNSCGNGTVSASYPITVNVLPAAAGTITGTSSVCQGQSAVSYNVGAIANATSYTWAYSGTGATITGTTNSVTVSFASNATSGNLTVQGVNSCGNGTVSANYPVTVNTLPPQPTITAIGATTFCQGGSVTLNAPLSSSYSWSNGATTQSIIVTTGGSYTVQVTNASGCQSVPSAATIVTVNPVPAQPTITAGGPTTLCTGGSVTLTSSAGVSYLWSTGATTQSIDVTIAGSYTVQVISAAGCTSVASAATVVTVNALPAQPTITAGGPTTFCAGGSVTLTSSTGSTYLWSTGATTSSINVTVSGSYTVRVTNAAGCQSITSAATIVTVNALPAQPVITAGGAITFCAGGSVTLSSSAGTTYLWSNGQTTQSIDVNTSGSYTVRVTNAAGCQSIASAATAVTVNALPVVNAGTDASIFNGGSTTLNATVTGTSPFIYSWAPANMLENATVEDPKTVNLSSTTTFTLTTTSTSTTCTNSDAVTITVTGGALSSLPTATPSTVCAGSNVQLAAVASGGSGTYTYSWTSTPAGFISSAANPTVAPTVNTVYHVAVNDGSNTVNAQVSVTVNASPSQPVITATGSTTFCAGSSVVLTSTTGTTYLWSTGATTPSITIYTSGSFTVRVTNASGCQSIASVAAVTTVNSLPAAPIVGEITPPTCSMATGSVLMMGLPSTGTWTLVRYPGTIPLEGSGASFTVNDLNSGIYNYSVINASGCTSTLSANVNIPAQPATPTTPLVGTVTQPTYTVPTGSVNLSGLPVSGSWTLTILPGGATINASGTSRNVTGLDPGTYTFTVTNAARCTSLPTANVVINARPGVPTLVINNPPTICSDKTADLTLPAVTAGSDENLTYTYWTDAVATVAYATPTTAAPGTYYIRGTSTAGFYNTKPVVVTADQLPVANAGLDQVLDFIFGTTLNADLPEIGVGLWSLVSGAGEIFNSAAPATDVNGLNLGENVFRWSVTNGVCEPVNDDVMIKVNDLIIPTLITPNGDSRNDYFVLRGLESLGSTELVIFDRRGMKVYENSEYDNTWEGLDYNSNPLPDDTYFYVIKTASGKSLSGYIVVRR